MPKGKPQKNKKLKHAPSKKGLPPGTAIYTGQNAIEQSIIEVIDYSADQTNIKSITLEEFLITQPTTSKRWINVNGISNEKYVRSICDAYKIHYLYQEDIMNVFQRPKVEEENDYLFMTFKSLNWQDDTNDIDEEQFSFFLLQNTVITFQEKVGDNMEIIRDRLKNNTSIIKEKPIDYLFYRLIDVTVDNYFDVLEKMGDHLESIENNIMEGTDQEDLVKIQNSKKDIMQVRKNIYPLRDVLNKLINSEHPFINDKTKRYFKDVLDHTIQILETTETYRDINISLKDVYLNAVSNEMNKIMKILTIISTFFIPLTFIVGVYGMNFKHMPELEWPYGYYAIWVVMLIIVVVLTMWFKQKKWF